MLKSKDQLLAEYASLINAAVDAIIVINGRGRIESFNRAAHQLFGYSLPEVDGKNISMLMPEPHQSEHDHYLQNYLQSGQAKVIGIGREVKARHKDGHVFPIHLSVNRFDVAGSTKFVGIVHDLTEQKKKELALKQARDEARRHRERLAHVDRLSSMGEMAAGIAHEINQPLSAIASYSAGIMRLLDSGNFEPQAIHEAVSRIAEQAHRSGEVIQRIRQFAKKQGQAVSVEPNRLVQDIAKLVELDSRRFGVVLSYDLADDLPKIKVDPVQIQQVLMNLIRNAFEAMAESQGLGNEILVSTRLREASRVEFAVSDQGPGVVHEAGEDVFAPFFSTKQEGMGMGLSISSTIIRANQGELNYRANPDLGATFFFSLPIEPETE